MERVFSAALAAACLVIGLGCGSRPSEPASSAGAPVAIAPPAPSPSPEPAAAPTAAGSAVGTVPSAQGQPGSETQQASQALSSSAGRPALGATCSPQAGAAGADPCGTKRRVSLELDSATIALMRGARCEPRKLREKGMYAPLGCVSEGVLYAGSVCFACRLVDAGWSARAVIQELTKEQATGLQKRLGLDDSQPLTTESAWRSALEAASVKK